MMLSLSSTDVQLPSPRPQGLAKYVDRREMARGGNGVLLAARDQIAGRTVAIKMLLPEHRMDRYFRRRLLREARVTAQLEHPGTVPVHEIGDDEECGIYYVMKRISGENFFSVLRQIATGDQSVAEAFPLYRRIEVVQAVCRALAFAHVHGVIHRDVKPENMWVGNFAEVTLLDWGAAKVWGESEILDRQHPSLATNPSDRSSHDKSRQQLLAAQSTVSHFDSEFEPAPLTEVNQLIGTPTYMSPEQVGNRNIDERSDIFSAGVCLYEAMAIAEPFRGRNQEETFDNICSRQPTPPSERSPAQGIPQEADEIVARAINKNPSMRYQSMREFDGAIEQLMKSIR